MVLAAGDVTEFLSIDLTTIIATLLNTLILFLVLKHFLFDKVNKVIEGAVPYNSTPTSAPVSAQTALATATRIG